MFFSQKCMIQLIILYEMLYFDPYDSCLKLNMFFFFLPSWPHFLNHFFFFCRILVLYLVDSVLGASFFTLNVGHPIHADFLHVIDRPMTRPHFQSPRLRCTCCSARSAGHLGIPRVPDSRCPKPNSPSFCKGPDRKHF